MYFVGSTEAPSKFFIVFPVFRLAKVESNVVFRTFFRVIFVAL